MKNYRGSCFVCGYSLNWPVAKVDGHKVHTGCAEKIAMRQHYQQQPEPPQIPATQAGEDAGLQVDIFGSCWPHIVKGKAKMTQLSFNTLAKDNAINIYKDGE
jgi:hypothetical protein